ncbi:hypothetical protein OEZ86_000207 [Tetradesmus obliquus]|nr:hypothetical protein OEZ86_000207 [Tetradesmus obliquus]
MAVDVTRENFKELLPAIREALEKCTFYSFDCEMTGLFTDGNKHEYLDDMQSRYTKMTESSKAYIITQYGLSCFEATGPAAYEARTFNFYLFPQPHGGYNRRFLCDASSLVFLASHGFDFNRCISQGVPYMPVRTRDFQLLQVNRSNEPRGDPVVVSSDEDKAFVAELVQMVSDWLAGRPPSPSSSAVVKDELEEAATAMQEDVMGSEPDEAPAAAAAAAASEQQQQQWQELALPPLNSYKRLLAYQELRKPQFGVEGHPGFWVKRLPDSRFLVLVRATAQQAEQLEAEARAARIAGIHDAAGFAAVFDLMRRSNKPAVGHNCLFDVSYGLYGFADAFLPATWRDFKKMARSWHPGGLWDTKHLARQLPEVFMRNTALAEVYSTLVEDGQAGDTQALLAAASAAAGTTITLPRISHAAGCDKYRALGAGEAAHEAGYDAYMTGAAFACLLPLVAGKIASDPTCSLARAHNAALQRAAAAAAAKAARAPGTATPEAAGAPQQTPPLTPMPQPLQQLAEQQRTPQLQQQQQQLPGSLLQFVAGVVGRINMTFTDIPYAALSEDDPIPDRPCVFYLSGLQPGHRMDDIWKLLQRQGLGSARITAVDSSSCLAEFRPEFVDAVAASIADANSGVIAMPWAEYALMRYRQQRRFLESTLAQSQQQQQQQQQQRSLFGQLASNASGQQAGTSPSAAAEQASVVLQITFRAPRYSQAGAVQQHLLQAGLLDFLLRILPANVQLQLRLLYCCSSFQAEVEEFKPLFSMQAQGRRQPELALADQR